MADGGSLHNVPLVLDNGSGTIRAGFAGTDLPAAYFPLTLADLNMSECWPER